ncbi:MAG: ABC transporter substrate-binding protein [Candidatus Sumerlaeota bacterium]|nr:ABC transporter substrate-binding protein [Candidatus Sumerlaeota bacterium]
MKRSGFFTIFSAFLMLLILVVFTIHLFQFGNLEGRLENQSKQIRTMGESVDRLRGELNKMTQKIQMGGVSASSSLPSPGESQPAPVENTAPPTATGPSPSPAPKKLTMATPSLIEPKKIEPAVTANGAPKEEANSAAVMAAAPSNNPTGRKWLHPEVRNYLQKNDYVMTAPEAQMEGVMIRSLNSEVKGFNPFTENAADLSYFINAYCNSSIADRNGWTNAEIWHGDLAERFEITDDGKEFTIYLKKGIKWQKPAGVDLSSDKYAWLDKPHEMTARDFKFTLDVTMNPQVENGFARNYYEDLESWKVIDDYTFVVRWKRKLYGNIENTISMGPVPEFLWAYDENGERFPNSTIGMKINQHWYANKGVVGTGPYRFADYKPGEYIRLERNEDYYDTLPAIKEIRYNIIQDTDQDFLNLKAGKLRFSGLRPSRYHDEIQQYEKMAKDKWPQDSPFLDGRINNKRFLAMQYSYIGWNADKLLFKDKRIRRAMTLACNRQGMIDSIYYGLGVVAVGSSYQLSGNNDPNIKPLPFDLKQAAALLKEAGWEDTDGDGIVDKNLAPEDPKAPRSPFEFTLLIYGQLPEWESVANFYKEDLKKIGVKMKYDKAEWSLMQKKMDEKAFDAFTGGWALAWSDDPYQLWHGSQADIPKGSNRVGFRNTEADQIIEKLRVAFDEKERVELFHRFHRILHEEQPYTFFRVPEAVVCWWNEVKRVEIRKTPPQTYSLPWWMATQ